MSAGLSAADPKNQSIFQSGDNGDPPPAIVPELPEKRKCTNLAFFVTFALCFLLMIPFAAILSMGGDINRFFYGYDKYGNTCGVKNRPIRGINCSGQDMTQKPIALLKYYPIKKCFPFGEQKVLPNKCVDSCDPPNELIFQRCYPACDAHLDSESRLFKQITELMHVIHTYFSTITVMTLTGLVLSFTIFIFLKCHVAVTFWTLVAFQLIIATTAVSFFWHKYIANEEKSIFYLLLALGTMGYVAFILLFIFVVHDILELIFRLYEETLNAVFKIPKILIQPLVTLTFVTILTGTILFMIILISSNECLKRSDYDLFTFEYVTNISTVLFVCYLLAMMFWSFAFADACQNMIISGAIGQYYFTREKSSLQQPLQKSFQLLTRYHLGTVACGSLLLTVLAFMGGIVEYVIRKVYIQTAIHGFTLGESTLRVVKLLCFNLVHTVGITGFTFIITYGFSVLITLLAIGVGMWMNLEDTFSYYVRLSILFGAAACGTVTFFVFQVLNVASDTIFLCFCEEQMANDGDNRDVFMNIELQEIAEKVKAFKRTHTNSS